MSFKERNHFEMPKKNNHFLWRYIDKWKLESILKNKSLFFCRADSFLGDLTEGMIPNKVLNILGQQLLKSNQNSSTADKKEFYEDDMYTKLAKDYAARTLVSCWNYSDGEDKKLWSEYTTSPESVVIKTTIDSMKGCFEGILENIHGSKVRYLDYDTDILYGSDFPAETLNIVHFTLHKRKQFEHEKEYRFVHILNPDKGSEWDWNKEKFVKGKGKLIKADIDTLISEVRVHPNSDSAFQKEVQQLLSDANLNKPVNFSKFA